MSFNEALTEITLAAGADLSAKQYFIVKVDSSGDAVLAGDGEAAIGILQNKPTSGDAATVAVSGVSKCEAGASITAGALVSSDASGNVVTAATGDIVLGKALASADDGDIIPVLIQTGHVIPA